MSSVLNPGMYNSQQTDTKVKSATRRGTYICLIYSRHKRFTSSLMFTDMHWKHCLKSPMHCCMLTSTCILKYGRGVFVLITVHCTILFCLSFWDWIYLNMGCNKNKWQHFNTHMLNLSQTYKTVQWCMNSWSYPFPPIWIARIGAEGSVGVGDAYKILLCSPC